MHKKLALIVCLAIALIISVSGCSKIDTWIDTNKKPNPNKVTTLASTEDTEPTEVSDDYTEMEALPEVTRESNSSNSENQSTDVLPDVERQTEAVETLPAPDAIGASETLAADAMITYLDEDSYDLSILQNLEALDLSEDKLYDSAAAFCDLYEGSAAKLSEEVNNVVIDLGETFVDYIITRDENVDSIRIDGVRRDASLVPLLVADIVINENNEALLSTTRLE